MADDVGNFKIVLEAEIDQSSLDRSGKKLQESFSSNIMKSIKGFEEKIKNLTLSNSGKAVTSHAEGVTKSTQDGGGMIAVVGKLAGMLAIGKLTYDAIMSLAPVVAFIKLISAIMSIALYPMAKFILNIFAPGLEKILKWFSEDHGILTAVTSALILIAIFGTITGLLSIGVILTALFGTAILIGLHDLLKWLFPKLTEKQITGAIFVGLTAGAIVLAIFGPSVLITSAKILATIFGTGTGAILVSGNILKAIFGTLVGLIGAPEILTAIFVVGIAISAIMVMEWLFGKQKLGNEPLSPETPKNGDQSAPGGSGSVNPNKQTFFNPEDIISGDGGKTGIPENGGTQNNTPLVGNELAQINDLLGIPQTGYVAPTTSTSNINDLLGIPSAIEQKYKSQNSPSDGLKVGTVTQNLVRVKYPAEHAGEIVTQAFAKTNNYAGFDAGSTTLYHIAEWLTSHWGNTITSNFSTESEAWKAVPKEYANWKHYAEGGIAMGATRINGIMGEAGPEALLPINKLSSMVQSGSLNTGGKYQNSPTTININIAKVEKSADIDQIIKKLETYFYSNNKRAGSW